MAAPTPYSLSYDFTSFQTVEPTTPLPADKIEIEYNAIAITTDELIANLGLLQKGDGTLANNIVKVENLAPELTIGLETPVTWTTATDYVVNNTVFESNKLYLCLVAHTSDVFATDLAANKWSLVADYASFVGAAEDAKDDAETAQAAAETAQAAAETAQAAAETAYDDFDDRYLGSKSVDPSLNNDGDALIDGALYWNTTVNELKVYDLGNTTWAAITLNSDERLKVSQNDVSAGYLEDKLVADDFMSVKVINDGGSEKVKLQLEDSIMNTRNLTLYQNY